MRCSMARSSKQYPWNRKVVSRWFRPSSVLKAYLKAYSCDVEKLPRKHRGILDSFGEVGSLFCRTFSQRKRTYDNEERTLEETEHRFVCRRVVERG